MKILRAWRGEDRSSFPLSPSARWRLARLHVALLGVLLWAATGFRDRLEGPYLFRRALVDEFQLVARTSAGSIGFEIGAKARAYGKRVGSTQIECAPRLSGHSKVANAENVTAYLGEILAHRTVGQGASPQAVAAPSSSSAPIRVCV